MQANKKAKTAIVIGAGPGGIVTALSLKKLGIKTVVLESVARELLTADVGGAYDFSPHVHSVLKHLDAAEHLAENFIQTKRIDFKTPAFGHVATLTAPKDLDYYGLRRSKLQESLLSQLDDQILKCHQKVIGCKETSDGGVEVRTESGETFQADVLIGADGVWSKTRTTFFPSDSLRFMNCMAIWGRSPISENPYFQHLEKGHVVIAGGGGKYIGAFTFEQEIIWSTFWATDEYQRNEHENPEQKKSRLIEMFKDYKDPISTLIQTSKADKIAEVGIWERPPGGQWTQRNVALIGDAAHAMSPFSGQGANSAMIDGFTIAQELAAHPIEQAFENFTNRRKKPLEKTSRSAKKSQDWMLSTAWWVQPSMKIFFRLLPDKLIFNSLTNSDKANDISDYLGNKP